MYNKHTWNKILAAPHHPRSAFLPCLEAFIVQIPWQQHPRSKEVCSSAYVRRTHLEQIVCSSSPSRKCIGTMLGGVHFSNSRAAASPLHSVAITVYWPMMQIITQTQATPPWDCWVQLSSGDRDFSAIYTLIHTVLICTCHLLTSDSCTDNLQLRLRSSTSDYDSSHWLMAHYGAAESLHIYI